jgi:hypothetical protein
MKLVQTVPVVFLLTWPALAQEGKLKVEGGTDLSFADFSHPLLGLNTSVEFFLLDRLSVGGSLSVTHQFADWGMSSYSLGPSLSYYVFKEGRWAAYLGQSLSYTRTVYPGIYSDWGVLWTSKLGLDYFLAPNISIGPAISYGHYLFREDPSQPRGVPAITGHFTLYF